MRNIKKIISGSDTRYKELLATIKDYIDSMPESINSKDDLHSIKTRLLMLGAFTEESRRKVDKWICLLQRTEDDNSDINDTFKECVGMDDESE